MFRSALPLLLLFALATAFAQDPRGTLTGRVLDSSDAAIPGAEVRVTNSATGVSAAARSNQSGIYAIPYLLPGKYRVTAEMAGFKKYSRDGIEIRVNDTVDLPLRLEVGDMTQSVEVTADTPLLEDRHGIARPGGGPAAHRRPAGAGGQRGGTDFPDARHHEQPEHDGHEAVL